MTKSKIFLYFCLSFVFGIAISSFFTVSQLLMLGFLILGILLISVFWRYKILVVIGFCLLFLVLGVWRHQSALEKPNIIEGETSLTGIVCQEPDVRMDNVKLTVKIEKLGKVLVTTSRYPQYQYGDQLKITGNLQIPHVFEDFNYQDYLAKDGIYSVMYSRFDLEDIWKDFTV